MKQGSKIAAIKRENAECEVLMKTFCLNPTMETYRRVSKCDAITRGEYYKTWKAMLPHYRTDEDLLEALTSEEAIDTAKDVSAREKYISAYKLKRDIAYRAIDAKISAQPTRAAAMQMLYIFAATGWFSALEKFYECMGDSRIGVAARTEMCAEYKEWKDLYLSRIHELVTASKDHFKDRGIDITAVDFSRFEVYQRDYDAKKASANK